MKLLKLPHLLYLANLASATSIKYQQPIHDPALQSSSSPLLALHKSLVEIESITGHEHDVAQYLISYLSSQNLTVETQDVGPGLDGRGTRQNILAYIGKQRKTKLLVSSHIDTVPPFWEYARQGDEIWGRGSVDAKGSVATQITAFEELREKGKIGEGDVGLLFVVGEETGGEGKSQLANDLGLKWDTVIFGEPTELKLASGHKGIGGFVITAKGKAGHSGYPELGKNAISMIVPALNELLNTQLPWSEKYGNTTLNFGTIEGGVAANVIAEEARAAVSMRIASGEPAAVEKVILDAIQKAGEELDVKFLASYGPVHIDSDVPGFETIVVNYGTDIPNLKGDNKRYLYGPGTILMAHSDHEHLKVSDLETAVKGYKALIEHALK
ncbi:Zn-dependent exopeptidase [Hyaloscypha hepaticicola]|uniref:Zn-dependent exopeptidase n=1 Tax=Hyaloscypha hepaticicola TaxID=2082293 RepID=A0A2J6QEX0_9HELO|nr:Zn-dependent exopeptidase [Hyaloscypha hepaticicola]